MFLELSGIPYTVRCPLATVPQPAKLDGRIIEASCRLRETHSIGDSDVGRDDPPQPPPRDGPCIGQPEPEPELTRPFAQNAYNARPAVSHPTYLPTTPTVAGELQASASSSLLLRSHLLPYLSSEPRLTPRALIYPAFPAPRLTSAELPSREPLHPTT